MSETCSSQGSVGGGGQCAVPPTVRAGAPNAGEDPPGRGVRSLEREREDLGRGQRATARRQPEPDHPARRLGPHAVLEDVDAYRALVGLVDAQRLAELGSEEVRRRFGVSRPHHPARRSALVSGCSVSRGGSSGATGWIAARSGTSTWTGSVRVVIVPPRSGGCSRPRRKRSLCVGPTIISRRSARSDEVRVPDRTSSRSCPRGKHVHSRRRDPRICREKRTSRGSSPPIRSHLAGSSEGLMPERIRPDLAHVAPGWLGAHEQRRTRMKHVRIATYEIKKGSFQELADVAQDGMLREFRNQPGFIRYGLADAGDKTCVSLSLWETRK